MLNKIETKYLKEIIDKYSKRAKVSKFIHPLHNNAFSNEDILDGVEVLLSQKLTMSKITEKFEYEFAKFIGSKYALMVNSGSSANLLASFALINPKKKNRLKNGDKFLIPSVCWSTSLWPLIQCGLKPKFIDVNKDNFCLDETLIDQKILKEIKAIVTIHILGNSSNIKKISSAAKKNNIFLIEDTCEALGSKYNSKYLGTYGDFGTYSFYYSHQITSGEGGMIVCNQKEDYEIIYSLRAHGWDRGLKKSSKRNQFNFINSGFNLRPMDLTAAIGLSQFRRLGSMMNVRALNREKIINKIKKSKKWNNQYIFFEPNKNVSPSWFGFPIMINNINKVNKNKFMNYLNKNGIETRPILSGNFLNQPSAKLYKLNNENLKFYNSQMIEEKGFFIGLPTENIFEKKINYLSDKLLNIDKFQ
jgi:CDP-6-deoxy-D-xylo-4-hexulose-3-dehydrase